MQLKQAYEFYSKIEYTDHATIIQALENLINENREELGQRDRYGITGYDYLLYVMISNKCPIGAIELLLKHGAAINHNYWFIAPPLIVITEKASIDIDIMKFLIENGADVNAPYETYGSTVLSRVLLFNDKEGKNDHVVEFLLDNGASLTIYWLTLFYIRGVSEKILLKAPFIPYGTFQLRDGVTDHRVALSHYIGACPLLDLIMQNNT